MKFPGLVTIALITIASSSLGDPSLPSSPGEPDWDRLAARQRRAVAEARDIDIAFVGDSLTAGWQTTGSAALALDFRGAKTLLLGIAGDRTEHILYRLRAFDFAKAKPRVFVLLAGTNNLAKDPPDAPDTVARAIAAIAQTLRARSPGSEIIVLSVLPSGRHDETALRNRIRATNAALAATDFGEHMRYLDLHDRFLTDDGRWKRGQTLDGTHLSESGYSTLSMALKPVLERRDKAHEP